MECLTALALFVAAMALAFAAVAHRRVRAAERAIAGLDAALRALRAPAAAVAAEPTPAETSPPLAAPPSAAAPEPEPLPAAPAFPPSPFKPALIPVAAAPSAPAPITPLASTPPPAPPRPAISLEERLGARLPVWIGSIALALAGAFLVKYSFEQGLLSPAVRVSLGIAFGIALLAGGEGMRRSSPRVSQGLSAAGIADLFACFLAGTTLYALISPAAGFALIALTAAVAVGLSLRQGPMVALIGLLGGFFAPYLIRAGTPNARNLFGYLLLLEIGFLLAARRRGWTAIAGLANLAGLLWVAAWLAGPFHPADALWLSLFLVLSAGVSAAAALAGRPVESPGALLLARAALALGLAALAVVAGFAGYSPAEWAFLELLAAAVLVLGFLDSELAGLAWVAAGIAAVLLVAWGWKDLAAPRRYLLTCLVLGLLFAGAGALGAWFRPRRGAPRRGLWGALAAASGVGFFLLAYGATRDKPTGIGISWGAVALGLALLYIGGAYALVRRRAAGEEAGADLTAPLAAAAVDLSAPLAAAAVGATAFVSLAVPLELARAWLTVAWAVEVPALLWLAGRFRLPLLTTLARALAVLVGLRLFYPGVLDYPIGQLPVLNWLLYGYGVPLAAFAGGAELARRNGDGRSAAGLELEALAFAWALATLEIRQAFHPGELGASSLYLAEMGTLAAAWVLLGWGAFALGHRLDRPYGRRVLRLGGMAVAWLGLLGTVAGPGLAANPLWNHRPVGETPVLNVLLWAFGLPVAAFLLAARGFGREGRTGGAGEDWAVRDTARAFSIAALVGLFVLLTLEVRQAFRGAYLDIGTATGAERYAYSAAWVLFATALLVLGIARRGVAGRTLRYASLAVMMIAVAKVFLFDTSNLGGLYRVFSFLGLGGSLLLLAFLYQRFVFREGR